MAWPDTDVGQFVQLQLQGTLHGGQQWRNSFHVWGHDAASPVEVSDLEGLLTSSWMAALDGFYLAMLGPGDTLDGVLARQVFDPLNPTDPKNEAFLSVEDNGTASTDAAAPTETTILLHLGCDVAGRSAHGRVFLPWAYDRGSLSGEVYDDDALVAPNAVRDQLYDLMYTAGSHAGGGAADFDLAVYSATLRGRDADQYGFRVTSAATRKRIHWLRSRGPTG